MSPEKRGINSSIPLHTNYSDYYCKQRLGVAAGISPSTLFHLHVIPLVQQHVFLCIALLTFHNITLELDLCNVGLTPMTEGFSLEIS